MKMKEKVVLESYGGLEEGQREGIPDIRDFTVVGSAGEEVGTVGDVFIDPRHHHMAFVSIKMGGVLGLGGQMILVPFDQIVMLDNNQIRVKTKDEVESEFLTGVSSP